MEAATLKAWTEGLGFHIEDGPGVGVLSVILADVSDARLIIQPAEQDLWSITHSRREPVASFDMSLAESQSNESPISIFTKTVHHVGNTFPLVRSTVTDLGRDVVVEFSAPLYGENLTRQSFALTLSAVAKAVQVFNLLTAERKRLAEEWAKIEAQSAERQSELAKELESLTAQAEKQQVAAAASPSSKPNERRRCPKCGQDVRANKSFCTACGAPML